MKNIFRDQRGITHVFPLMFLILAFMLLAVGMFIGNILTGQRLIKKDMQRAIVSCATQNLETQYTSMIEAESFTDAVDYNTPSGKATFYKAWEGNFTHFDKTENGDGYNYTVYNQSGGIGFTVDNLKITIAIKDMPLPDTKQKRLVYEATGTVSIPVSVLGFNTQITIPAKVRSTYQYTG